MLTLTTARQWKALGHPIRQRIVLLLREKELTNAEVADELGIPGGQLHFHTRQLLNAGLIEIVDTRMKGPITEKLYRATAKRFGSDMPPDGDAHLDIPLEVALDLYRRRGQGAWDAPGTGACLIVPMTKEIATQFVARLEEIQCDLIAHSDSPGASDDDKFACTIVMHRLSPEQRAINSPQPGGPTDEHQIQPCSKNMDT